LISIAVVGATAALLLAGCSTPAAKDDSKAKRACVILPDTESSPRWESGDRPALQKALEDAGFDADIQNAQGDVDKYAAIADQQLTQGCGVMVLVDHQGAALAVTEKAQAQGIPVIAYDRPIYKDPSAKFDDLEMLADYYVSFDNDKVGQLEGQMVVDGLKANNVDPATAVVVYMGGDPADGNAAMFRGGAVKALEAAGIKPAAEPTGVWNGEVSATNFEQVLTDLGGKVDAVWAANDPNAAGVITILDKNSLTVPVSGQDATVAGLQNVLLGKQTGTVWKPFKLEASAAADLIISLLKGDTPSVATEFKGKPFVAVEPVKIGQDNVQDVIDGGDATAADVCAGDVAAKCEEFGVK
jgi:D-xylose transport system substrate-binding protein